MSGRSSGPTHGHVFVGVSRRERVDRRVQQKLGAARRLPRGGRRRCPATRRSAGRCRATRRRRAPRPGDAASAPSSPVGLGIDTMPATISARRASSISAQALSTHACCSGLSGSGSTRSVSGTTVFTTSSVTQQLGCRGARRTSRACRSAGRPAAIAGRRAPESSHGALRSTRRARRSVAPSRGDGQADAAAHRRRPGPVGRRRVRDPARERAASGRRTAGPSSATRSG